MISLQIDYHKLISNHILYQKTPPDNDAIKLSKYAAFSTWRIEQTIIIQLDSFSFSGPRTECNDAHKYIVSIIVESWGHTELMSNHDSIPAAFMTVQPPIRIENIKRSMIWFVASLLITRRASSLLPHIPSTPGWISDDLADRWGW